MMKHYGSVYKRYGCFMAPEEVLWVNNGNTRVIQKPVHYIQFENYKYSTDNEEEQAFLEAHTDFERGMIMSLDARPGGHTQIFEGSTLSQAAPIPRLSKKILMKLTKEELLEYAQSIQVALPHSAKEILDDRKMTRDELADFLAAS